jgi:hypothetical protein
LLKWKVEADGYSKKDGMQEENSDNNGTLTRSKRSLETCNGKTTSLKCTTVENTHILDVSQASTQDGGRCSD